MSEDIPLALQTAYAELLDRVSTDEFDEIFPDEGTFTPKTVRGRRYWYFQDPTGKGRKQTYVGPETPELLERIAHHRHARRSIQDRQNLISALVRSNTLPAPPGEIGNVIEALAKAGVFRLRGVLVGTVAYQTYSAMLGTRLSAREIRTEDIDIAQFANISVAIGDQTPPMIDVLRSVDPSFAPISLISDPRRSASYKAVNGIRVDFLTPNKGADTDKPRNLPALQSDAIQLRYLDFLIADPEPAVLLHNTGTYVLVPSPQRFAIHKLIVARMRPIGSAKADKDLRQAEALLDDLGRKRPQELKTTWAEAFSRGKKWRQILGEGLARIAPSVRDRFLQTVGAPRSVISGLKLDFTAPVGRFDFDRDVVTFLGTAAGKTVRCAVSREALEHHFGADNLDKGGRLEVFRENRSQLERMAQVKFLDWPIEDPELVLIKTMDVEKLTRDARLRPARDRRHVR